MADPFQTKMPIKPDQILDIIIRRKWLILIPICITLTYGLFYALTAVKTYEASTLILVQPQRVPTNYVRSVVTSTINQRLSTISQQILSRSNLEKIIDQFGLYEDSPDMYLEDKILSMRKRVQVQIERARQGAEAFSIVFIGSQPQRVMRIANTLASYFMDENLRVREAQAVGTSEFLESELGKTKKRLERREKDLAEYRAKHLGGLPDELETNFRTLDRLQLQLSTKNEQLRQAKESLSMLETQISQAREMASQTLDDQLFDFEDEAGFASSENEQRLAAAQEQHDVLLLRYTEKHPDVAKVKKIIEKLEKAMVKEQEALEEESHTLETGDETLGSEMPNFAAMQQEMQQKQIKSEIKKIKQDIANIEQNMTVYQKKVEDTPKRELELQSLQRDYANIQNIFNSLLDRQLESEISVNMEKKQKGEQFRILDHARLPEKPISPNVKMLFLLSVVSGLGFSAGLIFLLEGMNTAIIRNEQIEEDLDMKILAIIPPLKISESKTKKNLQWAVFICMSLYAVLFLSFFAVLNYNGLDRTINLIKLNF
ncbi:MAG: Wzz/FepE/Etk N-terminal domain-containing protein [Thermodesulfobacteriota bacterium]